MPIAVFKDHPFQPVPVVGGKTGDAGMVLADIAAARRLFVPASPHPLGPAAFKLRLGAVQTAARGAIQDPAGSAVGGSFAGAGGASGAIYDAFNGLPDPADHLLPIPKIPVGASVFNASAGKGRRVLHTFSPDLRGLDPTSPRDRGGAIAQIANGYYAAILAFNERAKDLGVDGKVLNLVPLSSAIFAGGFRFTRPEWDPTSRHLDPTYSIAALMIALARLDADGAPLPALTLSYYLKDVYATAVAVRKALAPMS